MRSNGRALALCALVCAGCPGPVEEDAGADVGADAPDDDAPAELRADAGPNVAAYVDEDVVLDGSRSTGAISFAWATGDGRRIDASAAPTTTVRYPAAGRYTAVLTVEDGFGTRRTDALVVTITNRPVFVPRQSSSIAVAGDVLVVAVQDADQVATYPLMPDGSLGALRSVTVCDGPRQVAAIEGAVVVSCPRASALVRVDTTSFTTSELSLPRGSAPFGVLALDDGRVAVSLQATGELALVDAAGGALSLVRTLRALPDARPLALLPDGRVLVGRWRSQSTGAELAAIDLATGVSRLVTLAVDPQMASDTEIGGVPSYLSSIAVSPDGRRVAIASLQAAITEGTFVSGRPLRFETTVRAAISFVAVAPDGALTEDFGARTQIDNRGFANAVAFSERGDFGYVAMRGNRTIERFDALRESASGSLGDLGYAIEGLALRGARLYADVSLSRRVRVLALDGADALEPVGEASTVAAEPLAPEILLGAQLFNDSADPRLSRDGYIACAHCHLDGLDDHRVWDFTDRGEGLRNTIDLSGRGGEAHGPIHWSGNFDEIEDFENDIRGPFRGTGLLSEADFLAHAATLGPPKRGLSAELDALAAYVRTLALMPSPFRDPDGSLSDAATRGRALFLDAALGCTTCHGPERLTDSVFVSPGMPLLHDVGTLGPGSGMRLGTPLLGIDTPTLRGLFGTAPYLHDGSAATLHEVLRERNPRDQHGTTSGLSEAELEDLIAYLLSIDDRID